MYISSFHLLVTKNVGIIHGLIKNAETKLRFEIFIGGEYLCYNICLVSERDSIATGWTNVVWFLAGARGLYVLYSVQTGFGAQPASYITSTGATFPGGTVAGA
jgi:hypothetical protein